MTGSACFALDLAWISRSSWTVMKAPGGSGEPKRGLREVRAERVPDDERPVYSSEDCPNRMKIAMGYFMAQIIPYSRPPIGIHVETVITLYEKSSPIGKLWMRPFHERLKMDFVIKQENMNRLIGSWNI